MNWEVGVMEEMKAKKTKEGKNMQKLKADMVQRLFLKVWCRINLGKWKPWGKQKTKKKEGKVDVLIQT